MSNEIIENTPEQETATNLQQETKISDSNNNSDKEENLRLLREKAAMERAAREQAEQKLREMEQYLAQQKQNSAPKEDEFELDDEEYLDGKKFKKYINTLKRELNDTRKHFQDFTAKNALEAAEIKLKSQYSDFDSIVSEKNIKALQNRFPEEFAAISSTQDLYAKGKTAYNIIKNYGISSNYSEMDRRIDENKNKPRSSSTFAGKTPETPLTRVGDFERRVLTEERKQQLREQMRRARE